MSSAKNAKLKSWGLKISIVSIICAVMAVHYRAAVYGDGTRWKRVATASAQATAPRPLR